MREVRGSVWTDGAKKRRKSVMGRWRVRDKTFRDRCKSTDEVGEKRDGGWQEAG